MKLRWCDNARVRLCDSLTDDLIAEYEYVSLSMTQYDYIIM